VRFGKSIRQVCLHGRLGPGADPRLLIRADVVGLPALRDRSGIRLRALARLENVARGMALTAVSESLDEVLAAIPLR
jgi:hypothetical protein